MQRPVFFLCFFGWRIWLTILLGGAVLMAGLVIGAFHYPSASVVSWVVFGVMAVLTLAGLAFFRDFPRRIPADPDVMVAPADGRVTEITRLEQYEPLGGPALRLGIFLSVLDVHVNRAPCAGRVLSTHFQPGLFLDARHPESGPKNQSFTVILADAGASPTATPPTGDAPIAVVKQIVGAIARRILSPVQPGDVWRRGQRFGMIAFGSRTELYVPAAGWQITVRVGQHVRAGRDIVARRT